VVMLADKAINSLLFIPVIFFIFIRKNQKGQDKTAYIPWPC